MSTSESAASGDEISRPLSSPPAKPEPPASFSSSQPASALPVPPPPPPAPTAAVSTTSSTAGLPPAYGGQRSAQPERTSGWEKVDKVASTGEAVVNGIGTVIMKLYGVALIIVGIVVLVGLNNPSRFFGLLISAYGVYLVAPGSKFVIY